MKRTKNHLFLRKIQIHTHTIHQQSTIDNNNIEPANSIQYVTIQYDFYPFSIGITQTMPIVM